MNILCKVLKIESAALYRDDTERMIVGICDEDGTIARLTLRNGDGLKVGDTFWLYSEDEFAEPPPRSRQGGRPQCVIPAPAYVETNGSQASGPKQAVGRGLLNQEATMLESKFVEVRDRGTCIPCIAFRVDADDEAERWAMAHTGFGQFPDDQRQYVFLVKLVGPEIQYDPFAWGQNPRTMFVAHQWLEQHICEVPTGHVVDVQYILGETAKPKGPDRATPVAV